MSTDNLIIWHGGFGQIRGIEHTRVQLWTVGLDGEDDFRWKVEGLGGYIVAEQTMATIEEMQPAAEQWVLDHYDTLKTLSKGVGSAAWVFWNTATLAGIFSLPEMARDVERLTAELRALDAEGRDL